MDRRGRCTAETEPQLLQARPAEDFAELAVAPPGVWACTAEGGRVKSWSPLLAATPPTAVPSPVRASPSSELSLPVPSFGTLSLLLSRASAECPSLCFYLCQDGQPLAGLGWCPWSRRCLASVLGAGLSRDETWFLKNHDFSSLWVWQRGAGGGLPSGHGQGKASPAAARYLGSAWGLASASDKRECVELQVWALVGAPGWVAALVVPVNFLMSPRLIAPGTPQKSISPPFPSCCECSSLASGYLVEVGLQLHTAQLQGLDGKERVVCITP